MVTICESHIDSFNILMGVEGDIYILWVSASNHGDRDQTPQKGSQIWVFARLLQRAVKRGYTP